MQIIDRLERVTLSQCIWTAIGFVLLLALMFSFAGAHARPDPMADMLMPAVAINPSACPMLAQFAYNAAQIRDVGADGQKFAEMVTRQNADHPKIAMVLRDIAALVWATDLPPKQTANSVMLACMNGDINPRGGM